MKIHFKKMQGNARQKSYFDGKNKEAEREWLYFTNFREEEE